MRRHLDPASATRRDAILVCWAPTGRRKRILLEQDFGDDLRSSTHDGFFDRLYWTLADGTVKALDVEG